MQDRVPTNRTQGVCFPLGGDGQRSTQATGRAVFADCVRAVDPGLAERIEHTNDWRRGYLAPLRDIVQASASSPDAALAIAQAGLASVYQRFRFGVGDSEVAIRDAMTSPADPPLGSAEIIGRQDAQPGFSLPYRGTRLFGRQVTALVDSWIDRGIAEPGLATAIEEVMDDPQVLDLRGMHVAVLGAGAQLGPTRSLLRWGATVHAIDLPGAASWQRLIAIARSTAGTLRIPINADRVPSIAHAIAEGVHPSDDAGVAQAAGVDLVGQAPGIADWLGAVRGPLAIGSYAYADGATHVLLSVASDAIVSTLSQRRDDLIIASLATPTDAFIVPAGAVDASRARWAQRGLVGVAQTPLRITGAFRPNYPPSSRLGDGTAVQDALVPQQGPNYALAKRIQRWRALVAAAEGHRVSINLAPATRTRSVVRNRVLAAAYAGADHFGVEVFDPATSTALMAALLARDLTRPRPVPVQPPGMEPFAPTAVHGGLWRTAYAPRSVLGIAAIIGVFEARA